MNKRSRMLEQAPNISNLSDIHDDTDDEQSSDYFPLMAIAASVSYIVCLFIIIVNTLFLICFFINRQRGWVKHSKNIISIVMMDWLVGFTALGMLSVVAMSSVNMYVCVTSQIFCISSQVGSHMNIFRLCVFRFTSLRASMVTKETSTKSIITQTLLVYIVSSCLCSLPVFIWASRQTLVDRCTWSLIYREHTDTASEYMLYVTLVPAVVTSVLYIGLCIELKRTLNRVSPGQTTVYKNQQNPTNIPRVTKPKTNSSNLKTNDNSSKTSTAFENSPAEQALPTTSAEAPPDQLLDVPKTRRIVTQQCRNTDSHIQDIAAAQRRRLTEVFKTIGAILLCMNISICPYITVVAISLNHGPVSGHLFLLVSAMLLLNSALDPIIYMARIKHLKTAMKKMLRRHCLT